MNRTTTVTPLAARTAASGASPLAAVVGATVAAMVEVTAVSGTAPSLTVSLEWSHDNVSWFTAEPADSLAAMTATGNKAKTFTAKAPYVRATWAISGTTPSFTFAIHLFSTN